MISIIAAMSRNRVIGKDNKIPWHLPEDLKRFKSLTKSNPVIMGRKTYESLGKALPGRLNIVVTKNRMFNPRDALVATNLEDAINTATCHTENEIFIIGGGEIYCQALDLADRIYLTIIDQDFTGDTFFPQLNPTIWRGTYCSAYQTKEGLYYCFLTLEKNKADS